MDGWMDRLIELLRNAEIKFWQLSPSIVINSPVTPPPLEYKIHLDEIIIMGLYSLSIKLFHVIDRNNLHNFFKTIKYCFTDISIKGCGIKTGRCT